jgi:hypothetical protein
MAFQFIEQKMYSRFNRKNYFLLTWEDLSTHESHPIVLLPCSIKVWMDSFSMTADQTYCYIYLQGSIDGSSWYNLKDTNGIDIDLAASLDFSVVGANQVFSHIRPYIDTDASGASGTFLAFLRT